MKRSRIAYSKLCVSVLSFDDCYLNSNKIRETTFGDKRLSLDGALCKLSAEFLDGEVVVPNLTNDIRIRFALLVRCKFSLPFLSSQCLNLKRRIARENAYLFSTGVEESFIRTKKEAEDPEQREVGFESNQANGLSEDGDGLKKQSNLADSTLAQAWWSRVDAWFSNRYTLWSDSRWKK